MLPVLLPRLIFVLVFLISSSAIAESIRTQNFVVSADTAELATEVGNAAERYRKDLAVEWTGEEMPPWASPCYLTVMEGPQYGASGVTSMRYEGGEVYDWKMTVRGTREVILSSVLPHEVTHTVLACYFRQPLPRWADEGICTFVEHPNERVKQERRLIDFLKTKRGIPLSSLFTFQEYPNDIHAMYAQGYSVSRFLILHKGRRPFLRFLRRAFECRRWTIALHEHYEYRSLRELQDSWLEWVRKGSPEPAKEITSLMGPCQWNGSQWICEPQVVQPYQPYQPQPYQPRPEIQPQVNVPQPPAPQETNPRPAQPAATNISCNCCTCKCDPEKLSQLKEVIEHLTTRVIELQKASTSSTSTDSSPEVAEGPVGPQGPAGPEGPQGPPGPQGPEGKSGKCNCDTDAIVQKVLSKVDTTQSVNVGEIVEEVLSRIDQRPQPAYFDIRPRTK